MLGFTAKTAFSDKQSTLHPKDFSFQLESLQNQNLSALLTLMLKPRPPVGCLRSTTVLCFRKWEFLIGKEILWTFETVFWSYAAWITMQASNPLAHLHLLGIHFHLCKLHPASVWLMPLWSVSGRHHRYCWSPHCTAKQFQIVSVEIEKSIDILPSRAIMYTMNILILFSQCAICVTHSPRLVLGWLVLHPLWNRQPLCGRKQRIACSDFHIFTWQKKGRTKVQEIALDILTFSTET